MVSSVPPIENGLKATLGSHDERTRELESVLAHHLPLFHRYALRYLGNVADAQDAVQDALLSAYVHLDQFKEQARMSTWLMSIVLNSARMQLRQRGRRTYLPIDDECRDEDRETLSVQIADDRPSPEEECCAAELNKHFKPLITRLSDNLRQTFELRHFDGLSIRETARRLKVPVGTVKARLTRARRRLQRRVRSLTLAPRPGHCLPPLAGDSSTRAEFGDRKIKFKEGKSRELARSLLRKAPPSDSTAP
jgi:RNA polymerase sigma-70 factor, ECF subfamily